MNNPAMERWTTEDPCELVQQLAASIRSGLWLNLIVTNIDEAIRFQVDVLHARVIFADEAFAIMAFNDSYWMLHNEATYAEHPIGSDLKTSLSRGGGCELRLQNCDPDQAEARARSRNCTVIAAATDKPHGMRECYLQDEDGFIWVPSVVSGM